MIMNLDMITMVMKYKIINNIDDRSIITMHEYRTFLLKIKLMLKTKLSPCCLTLVARRPRY